MRIFFSIVLVFTLIANLFSANKKDTQNHRSPFLPDHYTAQFAGNIGVLSAGFGYQTASGRLSSDLMIGYVPHFIGNATIITISQKNTIKLRNFRPSFIQRCYPSLGLSINIETGNNSFISLPSNYPEGYYSTNAVKFGLFTGLNYQGKVQANKWYKQFEYYAELGTLGSYIYYNIMSKDYLNLDIFSLALGVKIRM